MTEPFVHSATPVFTVDDEDVGEMARDAVHLRISDSTEGLRTLNLRLVATGPLPGQAAEGIQYLDGRLVDLGKRVKVSLGPPSMQRILFEGAISAIEIVHEEGQEPEIWLSAEDRMMDLRMTRRSRVYEDATDADILAEIAAEHGLTPDADVDGPTYDAISQFDMSDLAFLRDRARLLQADLWVDGETLAMKTRDRRAGTEITLARGADLTVVRASADLAHQRTAVSVAGYDARDRSSIDESAGAEAVEAEMTGGRSGPMVLSEAFGERPYRRLAETPLTASEAADWARAEMQRRARGFVSVSGITRGTPDLVVGSRVTLERVGAPFDGPGYYVTQAAHEFDLTDGHRTEFHAERPALGPVPGAVT